MRCPISAAAAGAGTHSNTVIATSPETTAFTCVACQSPPRTSGPRHAGQTPRFLLCIYVHSAPPRMAGVPSPLRKPQIPVTVDPLKIDTIRDGATANAFTGANRRSAKNGLGVEQHCAHSLRVPIGRSVTRRATARRRIGGRWPPRSAHNQRAADATSGTGTRRLPTGPLATHMQSRVDASFGAASTRPSQSTRPASRVIVAAPRSLSGNNASTRASRPPRWPRPPIVPHS